MRIIIWPFYLCAIMGAAATAFVSLLVMLRVFRPATAVSHG